MNALDLSRLPVTNEADVVVCGGGTAGVFAAIACANQGKDTLLIEQFGSLGGTATNGLVTPLMSVHISGNPQCSYLYNVLQEKLLALGAGNQGGTAFDPLMLRYALEQMCVEAGVRLLYHTFIPEVIKEGNEVTAVVIANKAGLSLVKGKIFIDATGDGDISVRAGAEYNKGNPETGINQPMSLRYIIDGIDMNALGAFFNAEAQRTGVTAAASVWNNGVEMYAHCCRGTTVTLTKLFEEAIEAGDLTVEDHIYWQAFGMPGRYGSIAFNCPEFFENIDGTNPEDLSISQVKGKEAIVRQLAFYKKYMKGFEKAYIAEIAPMVGVRESREIICDHVLTAENILGKQKFEDMIAQSNYPIDIHGKQLTNRYLIEPADDGKPWYEIPFRSLIVKSIDNLLVVGRCIGAEFIAEASVRIQPTARSTGEAAGIGAALAIEAGKSIREISGADVRAIMIEKGAKFA